jgi:hypothetical protein
MTTPLRARLVLPVVAAVLVVSSFSAVAQHRPAPAVSTPLTDVPVNVREQPLSSGSITHAAQVRTDPGQAQVTVRSIQPDTVLGNYRIDFAAMDVNGDGFIGRDEAQANPALADEFNALDTGRRGKLTREQLAGWLR